MKLKYKNLTKEQKAFICNGCGAKGGWVKPPNFVFKASCNHHDFLYYVGSTLQDKVAYDKKFYKLTKEDILRKPFATRWFYHTWAYVYFVAVDKFGDKAFNFSDRKRTVADLELDMQLARYTVGAI